MGMCGYCHFECRYAGDKEICPLYLEENKDKEECYDIDCNYYCDCDNCITIKEG